MLLLLQLVISLLFNTQEATTHEINITHSNELETVLCHSGPFNNDTIIVLSTNITHEITNILFCLVNTSHSLTIKSATNSLAQINCSTAVSKPSYPTSGFVFVNLYNLTLQKLSFQGCGAFLRDLDESILSYINSTTSPVYFTEYHSSLLLFFHIETLLIKEVNMLLNYGFSILAINSLNATIENINVTSTKSFEFYQQTNMSLGNGVLLLLIDEDNKPHSHSLRNSMVLIEKARFLYNYDYINNINIECLSDLSNLVHQETFTSIPVVNAAGLTILYTQQNFSVNVQISSAIFQHNYGTYSGAMLVLHFNSVTNSQTLIDSGNIFRENYNLLSCHGAALSFLTMFSRSLNTYKSNIYPLIVSNSRFSSQKELADYSEKANAGAVSVVIQNPPKKMESNVTVTFSNVTFSKNLIKTTGSCLYATTYSYEDSPFKHLIIVLENIVASKNSQGGLSTSTSKAGMFTMINVKTLYINGTNSHYYDNSGSVFELIDTNIILDGNISFKGNRGERGAVFKLYGSSTFHLNNGLRAKFINNIAHTKGGAIYAHDDIYKTIKQCTFQMSSSFQNMTGLNISMIFINNTAGLSGSSIYSTNLYNCYINRTYIIRSHNANYYYDSIFYMDSSEHSPLNLSTLSKSRCICSKNKCIHYLSDTEVVLPNISISAYPGQTLHVPMAAIDEIGNFVYAIVSLDLAKSKHHSGNLPLIPLSSWYTSSHDENQALLESHQCTLVNFTLYKRNSNSKRINDAVLVISSPDDSSLLKIKLNLLDCPLGFQLNTDTSTCQCSPVINKLGMVGDYLPTCLVVSNYSYSQYPLATITRPVSTAWAGLMNITNGTNKTTVFGVALTCHESCNLNQDYTMFLINGSDVLIADPNSYLVNHIPLCPPTKTGPLCSTCTIVNGIKYSVVFGSSECKQCSNWWLLTLILYAVAGPLLIYLLFALKLTLTNGTLNGIIFYAQAIGILNINMLSSHQVISSIYLSAHVFLSILNLNLGFPLCFYNGMTELWKAGLSLLFPLYLLTIVVVLIIFSRYSLWLSNRIAHSSVQVLVTVVHLSFISMFTAISNIVTPINIYTNDTSNPILKVWYKDGTVEYGKGGHLILMILIIVVVGPVLLSYFTIIAGGRPLMRVCKLREYIRPVYEAIHGPYKHNKEFFFTTRLLLLVLVYTLYILFRTGDTYKAFVIGIPTFAIYMTVEAYCRPFRKMWVNLLDLFIMWNYIIIVGTSWYFFKINNTSQVFIILSTTTTIVFLTLVTVIIFHIMWVTGTIKKIKPKLYILKMKFTFLFYSKAHYNPQPPKMKTKDLEGSFFDTYDETRESLLSPT